MRIVRDREGVVLDQQVAQEVSDTITAAIGHNVLITDDRGVVIGSGDADRVGTFHEASMPVIATAAMAQHNEAEARGLTGVRPGITLPLLLGRTVVGTVGITGPPGVVRPFGEIVRIQTEIMLRETMLVRLTLLRERALQELFADLAAFEADVSNEVALMTRAEELGYRLDLPRIAVAISVDATDDAPSDATGVRLQSLTIDVLRTLRTIFARSQDIVASVGPQGIGALCEVGPRVDRVSATARARSLCERTVVEVHDVHAVSCRAGIGVVAESPVELRRSYDDAWMALHLGRQRDPERVIYLAEDYRVPELLLAASRRGRRRYREAVLGSLTMRSNWPELRRTIIAWCQSGYRLVDTAGMLHVHRNTLLYRLERLEKLTGQSLRDSRHALSLYLACLVDDLDRDPTSGPP